jgi:hypothetical protein
MALFMAEGGNLFDASMSISKDDDEALKQLAGDVRDWDKRVKTWLQARDLPSVVHFRTNYGRMMLQALIGTVGSDFWRCELDTRLTRLGEISQWH